MESGRWNWLLLGLNVLLGAKTSNYLMLVPTGEKTLATTGQLFCASSSRSCPRSLSSESRSNLIQEEARVGCTWIAHPVTSSWATSTPCLPILTDRSGGLASVRFLLLDFSAEAVSWKIGQGLLSSASLAQLLHRSSIQPRSFSLERRGLL